MRQVCDKTAGGERLDYIHLSTPAAKRLHQAACRRAHYGKLRGCGVDAASTLHCCCRRCHRCPPRCLLLLPKRAAATAAAPTQTHLLLEVDRLQVGCCGIRAGVDLLLRAMHTAQQPARTSQQSARAAMREQRSDPAAWSAQGTVQHTLAGGHPQAASHVWVQTCTHARTQNTHTHTHAHDTRLTAFTLRPSPVNLPR
jgi:hypothetical protein